MDNSTVIYHSHVYRYYNSKVRKSPHVVGHYAAGARLIGLTEKQMAKHLATLSVTGGENQDSPYAQPLCMFTTNIPSKVLGKQRAGQGRIRLTVVKVGDTPNDQISSESNGEENNSSASVEPNVRISSILAIVFRIHNYIVWLSEFHRIL